MSRSSIGLSAQLQQYLLNVSLREPTICQELRAETTQLSTANMMSSPEQVQLLSLLARLIDAKNIIEIGTFTGYTSLRLALELSGEVKIICCDTSEEWTNIAKNYWQRAGVAEKIDLRLGPAQQTLATLIKAGFAGQFDFAYIDADKQNYWAYFEACLTLLRAGGMIAIDNVLWSGAVANPEDQTASTQALRDFNQRLFKESRVEISLVPIGDGLSVARKS